MGNVINLTTIQVAKSIAGWAYSDSLVKLPMKELCQAVEEDAKESGRTLTFEIELDSDCCLLVCACEGDEKAEEIRKQYPRTTKLLEEHLWT